MRCTAFLGVIGRQTAGACRLHMSVLPMKTGDGTGNGAANGAAANRPSSLSYFFCLARGSGGTGPKADSQIHNTSLDEIGNNFFGSIYD